MPVPPYISGRRRWVLAVLCIVTGASISLIAAEKKKAAPDLSKLPPASTQSGITYEKDIKPIFDETCVKCHGEKKQKGKLRLDSLAAVQKGGEDGAVVVAGQSTKSPLLINVAQIGDEDDYMPPTDKAKPLTKEQVGLIRAWIDQGAK
jgi:mono/diheme cytochrome c family protein